MNISDLTWYNAEDAASESPEQIGDSFTDHPLECLLLIRRQLVVDNATDLGQFSEVSSHFSCKIKTLELSDYVTLTGSPARSGALFDTCTIFSYR